MSARSRTWGLLALLVVMAVPAVVRGQVPSRPAFSSDRPWLSERAAIMSPGLWQAELGSTIRAEVHDEFLVGSALLRASLAGVEMRVTLPAVYVRHESGFLQLGDVGMGVKVPLDLGGAWWKWAALGTLIVPTGSESVNVPGAVGDATLIGEVELAGDVTLAMNAGYVFPFEDVAGGSVSFAATPAFPLPGSSGLRAYVGLFSYVRSGDDDFFVDWGLTRMAGSDRQWDLNAGYDPGSHVWFLGIGLAQRRSW